MDVTIEGFSGPLDMLCRLVESRQMQASKVKVTQIVRIYGAYLTKTGTASVDTLAEFFYDVAVLLLQKTLSLLPRNDPEPAEPDEGETEAELMAALARYMPYRAAGRLLAERKERRERSLRRPPPEEDGFSTPAPIREFGDIYFLSRLWWGILERHLERKKGRAEWEDLDDGAWGIPEAVVPEEASIQQRIEELDAALAVSRSLSLNSLLTEAEGSAVGVLVVTLLAVLEMCRMGKVTIEQETLFSDVTILAKG
ncbi:MAG: segregation/condensation protein A [Synergistaceae bacterium]|jgi:segregation and condensation protein A|nr:segregation/condensation protein A [Synergistaceae bacterium]